ncbi:MAG: hypothetical protein ABIK65_14775 [Candidatus Eisenbacteria bacterium]
MLDRRIRSVVIGALAWSALCSALPGPAFGGSLSSPVVVRLNQFDVVNPTEGLDLTEEEITEFLCEKLRNRSDFELVIEAPESLSLIDYDLLVTVEWREPGPEGHHLDLDMDLRNSRKGESVKSDRKVDLSLTEGQEALDRFVRELRGSLRILCTNYENARVSFDRQVGVAPFDSVGILLGTYNVSVSHPPEAIKESRLVTISNGSRMTESFSLEERPTLLRIRTTNGEGTVYLNGRSVFDTYKTYKKQVVELKARPRGKGATLRKRLVLEKHEDYDIVVDLRRRTVTGKHPPKVIGPRRPFLHTSAYLGIGYSVAIPEDPGLEENFKVFHNLSVDVGGCLGLFAGQTTFFIGIPQKNFSGLTFSDGAQEEQEIKSLYRDGISVEGRFILPLGRVGDNAVYPFGGIGYMWAWFIASADEWRGVDGEYHGAGDPGIKVESFYPFWTAGLNLGRFAVAGRVSILDPGEYESNWLEFGLTWNPVEEIRD